MNYVLWYCRSHATYYFIAAGCHISVKNYTQAQKLLDAIPGLIDRKKIGGKDLPTEVLLVICELAVSRETAICVHDVAGDAPSTAWKKTGR